MTNRERFFAKTRPDGDCLIWTARRNERGYGDFWFNGRIQKAHRVAYELARGPIPKGLEVNHKCRVKACVNIEHLELLTREEHVEVDRDLQRAAGAMVGMMRGRKNGLSRSTRSLPEGVSREGSKFLARIWLGVSLFRIGRFATPEEAHDAYLTARIMHGRPIFALPSMMMEQQ